MKRPTFAHLLQRGWLPFGGLRQRHALHRPARDGGAPKVRSLTIRTERGILQARDMGNGLTSVNMGHPMTDWADIPLAEAADTLHLPIDGDPVATSMGNPHCTFFVDDAEAVDLAARGPEIEVHPLFPERTNVQFVSLIAPDHLRMRVWERGTGDHARLRLVVLRRGRGRRAAGLTGRTVRLTLDGGDITVDWRDTGVWMTGPTAHVFSGVLTADFLEGL
jgi:diaminopimelate epimerase